MISQQSNTCLSVHDKLPCPWGSHKIKKLTEMLESHIYRNSPWSSEVFWHLALSNSISDDFLAYSSSLRIVDHHCRIHGCSQGRYLYLWCVCAPYWLVFKDLSSFMASSLWSLSMSFFMEPSNLCSICTCTLQRMLYLYLGSTSGALVDRNILTCTLLLGNKVPHRRPQWSCCNPYNRNWANKFQDQLLPGPWWF